VILKKWTPYTVLCLAITLFSRTIVFLTCYDRFILLSYYSAIYSLLIIYSNIYVEWIVNIIRPILPIIRDYLHSLLIQGLKIITKILHYLSSTVRILFILLNKMVKGLIIVLHQLFTIFYCLYSILTNVIKIVALIFHQLFNIGNVLLSISSHLVKISIKVIYQLLDIGSILLLASNYFEKFTVNIRRILSVLGSDIIILLNNFKKVIVTTVNIIFLVANSIVKDILKIGQLVQFVKIEVRTRSNPPKIGNEIKLKDKNNKGNYLLEFFIFINIVSFMTAQFFFYKDWEITKNFLTFCFCVACCISYFTNLKIKEITFIVSILLIICDIYYNPYYYYSSVNYQIYYNIFFIIVNIINVYY